MSNNLNRSAICEFASKLRIGVSRKVPLQFTNGTNHIVFDLS